MGEGSCLWVGGLLCPWVVLVMGTGWPFCLWAVVIICGCWVLFAGTGSLSVGAGLSIADGWAHSHGQVVHGCWFAVCGHGGDVSHGGLYAPWYIPYGFQPHSMDSIWTIFWLATQPFFHSIPTMESIWNPYGMDHSMDIPCASLCGFHMDSMEESTSNSAYGPSNLQNHWCEVNVCF